MEPQEARRADADEQVYQGYAADGWFDLDGDGVAGRDGHSIDEWARGNSTHDTSM